MDVHDAQHSTPSGRILGRVFDGGERRCGSVCSGDDDRTHGLSSPRYLSVSIPPQFVRPPDEGGEAHDEQQDVKRECGRSEQLLDRRQIDQRGGEGRLEGDAAQQHQIGEQAHLAQ
nr:hypothetical protein [Herbidospora sp. NBRC 101105]